jgi:hypothetical protein
MPHVGRPFISEIDEALLEVMIAASKSFHSLLKRIQSARNASDNHIGIEVLGESNSQVAAYYPHHTSIG